MGISIGGLATGLDSSAIINALVGVKRRPIALLENRRSQISTSRSDMNQLRASLEKLEEVAENFKKSSAFSAFTAESSDSSVVSATVDGSSQAGTFTLNVGQLAQQQVDVAQGFTDTTTETLGTGTLRFTVGDETVEMTLDSSNNTLTEFASAFNNLDLDVTATIVNSGGDTPYNLVFTTDDSGEDAAVTYDYTDYTAGDVDLSSSITSQQLAQNSEITVNGIDISRSTNLIDDAITGVTLNLLDVHESESDTARVTVAVNTEGVIENVEEFVDAYNEVQSFINRQFSYSEETGAGGSLFGDFTVQSVRSQLQSIVTSAVENDNTFGSLGAIGISSTSTGTLSLDRDELTDAIEEDADQVIDLFVEDGGAILESLEDSIAEFTKLDGILDLRDEGFDDSISDLNDQIDAASRRLDVYEESLTLRYASLESTIGSLQSQLSFLQTSLAR